MLECLFRAIIACYCAGISLMTIGFILGYITVDCNTLTSERELVLLKIVCIICWPITIYKIIKEGGTEND